MNDYLINKIWHACHIGDINTVKQLINDNECSRFDLNPGFEQACDRGDVRLVEMLISAGADSYNRALGNACESTDPVAAMQIVMLLIKVSERFSYRLNWNIGLKYSCYTGHFHIAKLMLEKGADVGALPKKPVDIDRSENLLDVGLKMSILSTPHLVQKRDERKESINLTLSFYLIDDLLFLVDGYSLWVL